MQSIHRRGFLKLLPLLPAALWSAARGLNRRRLSASPAGPNILVIVFDALSAANMSLYGYPRRTTPNIERVAARAVVYHRHYAGGNFTSPGTASLLTGVYPWTHRAINRFGATPPAWVDKNIFSHLASGRYTFAYTHNPWVYILLDQFRNGIHSLAPLSAALRSSNLLSEKFARRDFNVAHQSEILVFGVYSDLPAANLLSALWRENGNRLQAAAEEETGALFPSGIPNRTRELTFTLEDTVDWLAAQLAAIPKPYFGYVHLLPPHDPYTTRQEFSGIFDDGYQPREKPGSPFTQDFSRESLNENRRKYDEAIAYVDAEFGRLFNHLELSGALQDTWLVLTSDHGELFERGILGHVTPALYEPVIRIPLLVWGPGIKQRTDIRTPTSAVDLLPTLASLAGAYPPGWSEGVPLDGLGSGPGGREIFVVEAKDNRASAPLERGTLAMIDSRYKLIYSFGYPEAPELCELYDLERDPEEGFNLFTVEAGIARRMQAVLLDKLRSSHPTR